MYPVHATGIMLGACLVVWLLRVILAPPETNPRAVRWAAGVALAVTGLALLYLTGLANWLVGVY